MFEYPTAAGLVAAKLQPRLEVVREQVSLHGEETERISLRLIEGNRASVEREDRMQGLGNGMQECLLGQVRNDGVVDLKQDAAPLLTFAERRLRLYSVLDVVKRPIPLNDVSLIVAQRHLADQVPAIFSVRPPTAYFYLERFSTRQRHPPLAHYPVGIFGMDEVPPSPAQQLLLGEARVF